MSVQASVEEQAAGKEFIQSFVEKIGDILYDDVENLPKRPFTLHCSKDEIKGQCLFIALEYMRDSGASEIVATTVAYHATNKVLELDLDSYEEEVNYCEKKSEYYDDDDESNLIRRTIRAYNVGKLAVSTFNAVHEVCKEWKSEMPTLMKSKNSYEVYIHSEQNTRRRMEDKHMVITEFNNLFGLDKDFASQAFFAVFDGHGGVDCACYTVAHFHNNIAKQETFNTDLDQAISQAFLTTDKQFLEKAKNESLRAGTTGVIAMLRDNTLHIGWLGDSQVSMCKEGRAVNMMEPHKPNRKDERQRIEDLGGCVIWIGDWRVNGNIAVSRSIGDKDHKPYVSADPDTLEFDLEGDEEYLILGCDGLWDTIQAPDVIEIVQEHLKGGGPRSQVAKLLVERAIAHGSTDNVTVIVAFLDCHRSSRKEALVTSEEEGKLLKTDDEKAPDVVEGATKETGDKQESQSMEIAS